MRTVKRQGSCITSSSLRGIMSEGRDNGSLSTRSDYVTLQSFITVGLCATWGLSLASDILPNVFHEAVPFVVGAHRGLRIIETVEPFHPFSCLLEHTVSRYPYFFRSAVLLSCFLKWLYLVFNECFLNPLRVLCFWAQLFLQPARGGADSAEMMRYSMGLNFLF